MYNVAIFFFLQADPVSDCGGICVCYRFFCTPLNQRMLAPPEIICCVCVAGYGCPFMVVHDFREKKSGNTTHTLFLVSPTCLPAACAKNGDNHNFCNTTNWNLLSLWLW
jgi:hypothetical protein